MSFYDYDHLIHVLKLAERAGVRADRRGLTFRLGSSSDQWSSDGGPPAASTFYDWAVVEAGGHVVYRSQPWLQTEGPWLEDLPVVLEEIEREAEAVLEERAKESAALAALAAEQGARRAQLLREEQLARYLQERET